MSNRIFTDQELKELGTETIELLKQAIEQGDLKKARGLSQRMFKEFYSQHEGYRDTVVALLSFIGRKYGQDVLYEAIHDAFMGFADLAKLYEGQDIRRQVEMLAMGLRGHLNSLIIEEDDEKITVMMNPCGSGGRAILNGSYEPQGKFMRVKKHPIMTLDRDDFPVYCCHCPFQDLIPMEDSGFPIWVTEPSENLGKVPCKFMLYKDRKQIPEKYYQRLGMKKPS